MNHFYGNPEIDYYGNKRWYDKSNRLHREDGPAEEYHNGYKAWRKHGILHRIDGPAMTGPSGDFYYINNIIYPNREDWFAALTLEQKNDAIWNANEF